MHQTRGSALETIPLFDFERVYEGGRESDILSSTYAISGILAHYLFENSQNNPHLQKLQCKWRSSHPKFSIASFEYRKILLLPICQVIHINFMSLENVILGFLLLTFW